MAGEPSRLWLAGFGRRWNSPGNGRVQAGVAVKTFGAMLLLGVVALVVSPAPAFASCVYPPRTSANAFVGMVTDTSHGGRVATVRTDAGAVVTVIGTPDLGSGATSVDRAYVVGTRYEFHPINNGSPYQDNACTATHEVASGPGPEARRP